MLTIPMRNHEDENIGVLQLLNARGGDGRVIGARHLFDERADIVEGQSGHRGVHCGSGRVRRVGRHWPGRAEVL